MLPLTRQIPASLPHDPYRCSLGLLTACSPKDEVILESRKVSSCFGLLLLTLSGCEGVEVVKNGTGHGARMGGQGGEQVSLDVRLDVLVGRCMGQQPTPVRPALKHSSFAFAISRVDCLGRGHTPGCHQQQSRQASNPSRRVHRAAACVGASGRGQAEETEIIAIDFIAQRIPKSFFIPSAHPRSQQDHTQAA